MDFRTLSEAKETVEVTTLEITLSDRTLYLSDTDITVGGHKHEPLICAWGDIAWEASGEAGVTKDADYTFAVLNAKLGFQAAATDRFDGAFTDYNFVGCALAVKQNLQDPLTGTWYTKTVGVGDIQAAKVGVGQIDFRALLGQHYDADFPPRLFVSSELGLTGGAMGYLPKDAVGTPQPIIFGDYWNTPGLNESGHPTPTEMEAIGIVRNPVPVILYDPAGSEASSLFLRAASHLAHTYSGGDADKLFYYESGVPGFASLEPCLFGFASTATYTDAKVLLPLSARIALTPSDSVTAITSPRNAIDLDETTYATLDYSLAAIFVFEPISDLGTVTIREVTAIAKVTTAGDKDLEVGAYSFWDPLLGVDEATAYDSDPAWTYPTLITHTMSGTFASLNWGLTDTTGEQLHIFVRFASGATAGVCRLYGIAVRLTYAPKGMKNTKEIVLYSSKRRVVRSLKRGI